MTKQGVNLTILDGQLGQQPPGQGQTEVVIGTASSGTVANFIPYTTSNPAAILANSGPGAMTRLAAFITSSGGNPVTCVSVPNNAAGTVTAVAATTTNTGASVMTITGTPNDDYYLFVQTQAGGTFGTAGVIIGISLDGGATFAYTINMNTATTVTTGSAFTTYTGLSLSFTVATTVLNDSYYAVATAPTWTTAAIQSAINAVIKIKSEVFQDIIIAGVTTGANAATFEGYMDTLATTNKRFSRLLCSARDAVWGGASTETETVWINSIEADFGNNATLRVSVSGGYYRFIDVYTQSQMRSSLLYGAAALDSTVLPSTDLGEVLLGSLANVILPSVPDNFAKGQFFYHDEDVTPGLDAARFLSSWQLIGQPGIYIMNPNLMAPPGSDFNWLQHGHVIDEASTAIYTYFTKQLSSPVRVSPKTGFILPQDRIRLQNGCQAAINTTLTGQVSAVIVQVSATDNILSTATLTVYEYVVPLAYLKSINNTLALLNPANAASSQVFNAIAA